MSIIRIIPVPGDNPGHFSLDIATYDVYNYT